MDGRRALWMVALLAGLAGLASAQITLVEATSPASPINYGTPVTVIIDIFGDNSCGGKQVTIHDGALQLGTATGVQISSLPAPPECIAILAPNSYTSSFSAGTLHDLAPFYHSPETVSGNDVNLIVNRAPTTITLATGPNPSTWLMNSPFTVTMTVSIGSGTPTGTVTIYSN